MIGLIGAGTTDTCFDGTYNGNNKEIQNLEMTGTTDYTGLFTILGKNGTIKNTSIIGGNITLTDGLNHAVLVGGNYGAIDNCITNVTVTATSNTVSKIDAEYGLITTDITGSSQGSGVIVNLDGEIIGIIAQSFANEDTQNLITGLSISDSRELIQTLSGNQDIIYMGITGENITSEISEKKGIPVGVFVEKVEVDSPAMQVGIQNGDVITEVNGEKVETVKGYQQQLKACKNGDTIKVKAMRQGTEGYVEVSFEVTLKAK